MLMSSSRAVAAGYDVITTASPKDLDGDFPHAMDLPRAGVAATMLDVSLDETT